jgi:hypothetical protein
VGGAPLHFSAHALSTPADVTLSANSINFGEFNVSMDPVEVFKRAKEGVKNKKVRSLSGIVALTTGIIHIN